MLLKRYNHLEVWKNHISSITKYEVQELENIKKNWTYNIKFTFNLSNDERYYKKYLQ